MCMKLNSMAITFKLTGSLQIRTQSGPNQLAPCPQLRWLNKEMPRS